MRWSASSTTNRAGVFGVLAGVAGRLCCLGPAVALMFGAGASSVLWGLVLRRDLALALGALLLLIGFGLALRHTQACALPARARWRAPLLMLAAFVFSYGLLGMLLPQLAAQQLQVSSVTVLHQPAAAPSHALAKTNRVTLIIEKMDCPPCAAKVRSLLGRKPYVRAAIVEPGNQQVIIDYDPTQIEAHALTQLFPHSFGITIKNDIAIQ